MLLNQNLTNKMKMLQKPENDFFFLFFFVKCKRIERRKKFQIFVRISTDTLKIGNKTFRYIEKMVCFFKKNESWLDDTNRIESISNTQNLIISTFDRSENKEIL